MIDQKIDYSPKALRDFGLVMAVMLPVIFGLLLPWIWDFAMPIWPLIVAPVFALAALVFPKVLLPLYFVWMKLALVLGWINTRLILGLIFYVIIAPTGFVLRLLGKDAMGRKLDAEETSYRVPSKVLAPNHSERPF